LNDVDDPDSHSVGPAGVTTIVLVVVVCSMKAGHEAAVPFFVAVSV